MTKSQLIEAIVAKAPHVPRLQAEALVNAVFETMIEAFVEGDRIEIRGFGSIGVKVRPGRTGRNPKTGERVEVPPRRTLFFTCGKELRERLNKGLPLTAVERGPSAPPEVASSPPVEPRAESLVDRSLGEQRPSLG